MNAPLVDRLQEVACDRAAFTPDHANCICRLANEAAQEIARLRLVCRVAADQLEASYMHLPRDKYPGPPEMIIDRLRTAEPPTS